MGNIIERTMYNRKEEVVLIMRSLDLTFSFSFDGNFPEKRLPK
jgi:hypothetical protein